MTKYQKHFLEKQKSKSKNQVKNCEISKPQHALVEKVKYGTHQRDVEIKIK